MKRVFEFKNVQGYVQLSKMLMEFKTQFDIKTKIEVLDQLPIYKTLMVLVLGSTIFVCLYEVAGF